MVLLLLDFVEEYIQLNIALDETFDFLELKKSNKT